MITRFQSPNDDKATAPDPAAPIACTQCKKRKVHCDRVKPTCGECVNNSLLCRYTLSLLSEPMRDPLREIETRLKKMETQLRTKTSDKSTGMAPSTQSTSTRRRNPNFSLAGGEGGLCVETEITEAHHFIKLLFNTIDVTKVQYLAQSVFEAHLRSSAGIAELPAEPPDVLLNQLLARNNAAEQTWLDIVVSSQHHRCFIIYQMVGPRLSARLDYLHQYSGAERTRELLFAMAVRAYVFQHENELHQDTEYPLRTAMGPVYLRCAQALLEDCCTVSHRTTIRALLHLFLYHFHHKTEEAFPYCDLALRMALDLGLHERRSTQDPAQAEDDRRLWWAAYWCRLYTVVEYHRPTTMQDDEIQVAMPQRLPEENLDIGYCIDYCTMSIKLLRIRRSIAGVLVSAESTHALLSQIQDLEESLEQWHEQLPSHANLMQTWEDPLCTELGVLLHAQFYSIRLQMYQCFLDNAAALSLLAVLNCGKAAAKVIDMLVQHGASLRMCACIRLVPTLHRCVAVLACNAEFKESSTIAIDAIERLRQLDIVLRTHSFKYLDETAAVTRLIAGILRTHPPKPTTKPPKPIAPAVTTPPDQKPPTIVNNAPCLPSQDTPIVKQQPLEATPSPTQQKQYAAPITPTPQQLSDAYAADPIPPPPGGLSAAASAYTTQIKGMSASFGSLDQTSFDQTQIMSAYGQPIVPTPCTSFTTQSAYTTPVSGNGIAQFAGASATLPQQSTGEAWTASIPMNPQALSILSMASSNPALSYPSMSPYPSAQNPSIPNFSVQPPPVQNPPLAQQLPLRQPPSQHVQNSLSAQHTPLPTQQKSLPVQHTPLPAQQNSLSVQRSTLPVQQPIAQNLPMQRPTDTPPTSSHRAAPFSRGSIFHRAPPPPREPVSFEDPYLTKFPLIAPPISFVPQHPSATITELTNTTTGDNSNSSNYDTSSNSRSTTSPQDDTYDSNPATNYPWLPDHSDRSSSSSQDRLSPFPYYNPY